MPKLTSLAFNVPVDIAVTFDRDGAHLWDTSNGEPPEDAVRLSYHPGYATPAYWRESRDVAKDEDRSGAVWQFLQMVHSWDLQDDAGNVVPLTEAGLDLVPFAVLNGIAGCVAEDMAPRPKRD